MKATTNIPQIWKMKDLNYDLLGQFVSAYNNEVGDMVSGIVCSITEPCAANNFLLGELQLRLNNKIIKIKYDR